MTSPKRRQQNLGQTDPQYGINKHFQPTLGELFPAFKAAANNLSKPCKPNIEFISYCWLLVPNLLNKISLVMVDNNERKKKSVSTNISYDSFHSLSIKDDRAIAGYVGQDF